MSRLVENRFSRNSGHILILVTEKGMGMTVGILYSFGLALKPFRRINN